MSLKIQTVRGTKWLLSYSMAQRVLSFCTTIILARMLDPTVFGLYALAFVVIDGFGLFKSLGFDSALIQRKDDISKATNTAFLIIPLVGMILYLLLSISAPLVADFLENKELIPILRALGLIFVLNSFQRIPLVLLEKELKYKLLSITGITIELFFSIIAVIFSFLGFGIWSLVLAYLIKTVISVIAVWKLANFRPKWEFDKHIALDMFHFGKFVFLSSLLWFIAKSFDKVLIPKIIDIKTLGLYMIALNFATLISSYLTSKVSQVLFPAYSKLQDNIYDLQSAYLRVLKLLIMISLPISIGMYFIGGDFLILAYGEKWIGAASLLKVLAWLGICETILNSNSSIFLALKKPKINFFIDAVKTVVTLILMFPMGKAFGVNGIATIVLLNSIFAVIFGLTKIHQMLSVKLSHLISIIKSSIISSACMTGLIILLINIKKFVSLGGWGDFLVVFMFAASTYLLILYILEKDFVNEVKGLVIAK